MHYIVHYMVHYKALEGVGHLLAVAVALLRALRRPPVAHRLDHRLHVVQLGSPSVGA